MSVISQYSTTDATVIVGTVIDDSLDGSLRVTIVATGIDSKITSLDIQTNTNDSSISENTSSNNNLKKTEVDVQAEPIIDDNDIPAFLRKRD